MFFFIILITRSKNMNSFPGLPPAVCRPDI
jgi:hypothetical protein